MRKIIALNPILYKGKMYIPGEELPGNDEEMLQAWKRAESVKLLNEESTESSCDIARNDTENAEEAECEESARVDETGKEQEGRQESVKEGKRKK